MRRFPRRWHHELEQASCKSAGGPLPQEPPVAEICPGGERVVRNGEYWYVLVPPDKSGGRAFDYKGNLADTEEDIRQHERQPPNLLLIPVLPPDADGR